MPFCFGDIAHLIGKGHRFCKIFELELLGDPARIPRESPVLELFQEYFRFSAVEGRGTTFTGDALLLGEICHERSIPRYYYLYMNAPFSLFRRSAEAVLDAILPLRARAARTKSRRVEDFALAPAAHELLGASITTLMDYREQAVQDLIRSLKYDHSRHAASIAAKLLEDYLLDEIISHRTFSQKRVLIIPVPLHRARAKERGFNQIEIVLDALPQEFKDGTRSALATNVLTRVRETKQQTRLHRSERLSNVAGAFAVPDPGLVKDTLVFLIDDVTTTGATLVNAATPLRRAGAHVSLLALARA